MPDVDGFQIRTLILTMLYRLMPTLIDEGKVFIAESPLYEITTKDETYFAYSDREKGEVLQKIGDVKYTLQRSKGLGENEPEMMSLTTMNPDTRRLIQVRQAEVEKTAAMFGPAPGGAICPDARTLFRSSAGLIWIWPTYLNGKGGSVCRRENEKQRPRESPP